MDKPTIQYIVEEAVASGIESIVIITGRSKRAIEDHFDKSIELELELTKKNKCELLQLVEDIASMVNVMYVGQKEPLGLGHAILTAKGLYWQRTVWRDFGRRRGKGRQARARAAYGCL